VLEVPKAMTTKSLAPHHHSLLFQWCRSFKRTTTKSLAPHDHVFIIIIVLQVPRTWQWGAQFLVIVFFCCNIAGHSSTTRQQAHLLIIVFFLFQHSKSLEPQRQGIQFLVITLLFQCCRSFKCTMTRSLAPRHHVFFVL
jgi:hypothetical protein